MVRGKETAQALIKCRDTAAIFSLIWDMKYAGWKVLGINPKEMITLVSYIDLNNPEMVRKFFWFAPNDDVGMMGKTRLYGKVFASQEGRRPNIQRDLALLLGKGQRSYEAQANMVYALVWWIHYLVATGEDSCRFGTVSDALRILEERPRVGAYDPSVALLKSALKEGVYICDESATIVDSFHDGVLHINPDNADSVRVSLVRTFVPSLSLRQLSDGQARGLVRGAWTLKTIFVDDPLLMAADGPFAGLPTTQIAYVMDE